jgi:hypothetical protein
MYKIIKNKDVISLTNDVNHWVQQGYKPCGGISVYISPYSKEPTYVQALVKEAEK